MRAPSFASLLVSLLIASSSRALSIHPGDILLLGASTEVGGGIIHLDPVSGVQSLVTSGVFQDFAVTANGDLYAIEGDSVVRVDPQSGSRTTISAGGLLVAPRAIAASGGSLFVAILETERIVRIDSGTGTQSILTEQGFLGEAPRLNDLSLGAGGELLVLDAYSLYAEVVAVDLLTGAQTQLAVADSIADGRGLGVSSDGQLFVTDYSQFQALYRLDPPDGATRILDASFPDVNGDPTIGYPTNVAVDPSGMLLMTRVADYVDDLVRFDPDLLDPDPFQDPVVEYLAIGTFWEVEVAPVPEPGTALLVVAGLLGLADWRRRRA